MSFLYQRSRRFKLDTCPFQEHPNFYLSIQVSLTLKLMIQVNLVTTYGIFFSSVESTNLISQHTFVTNT